MPGVSQVYKVVLKKTGICLVCKFDLRIGYAANLCLSHDHLRDKLWSLAYVGICPA